MHRKRNCTVYTGRVGARMRPPSAKTRRRSVIRTDYMCAGGPFAGKTIRLDNDSGARTLRISVGKFDGYYACGSWVAAADGRGPST